MVKPAQTRELRIVNSSIAAVVYYSGGRDVLRTVGIPNPLAGMRKADTTIRRRVLVTCSEDADRERGDAESVGKMQDAGPTLESERERSKGNNNKNTSTNQRTRGEQEKNKNV